MGERRRYIQAWGKARAKGQVFSHHKAYMGGMSQGDRDQQWGPHLPNQTEKGSVPKTGTRSGPD